MRPPGKYDALRQAEQQAQEARDTPPQPEAAAAQLDSAQEGPTRPPGHPATPAQYSDRGEPLLQPDWAKQILEAAKQHEDAAKQAKGKDGQER